jgi:hypothetical protein
VRRAIRLVKIISEFVWCGIHPHLASAPRSIP